MSLNAGLRMMRMIVLLRSVCLALLLLAANAGYGEDLLYTYQLAVQNDPVLQQAEAQHKAQLETKPQSLAQLLPDFSISAHTTENSQQRTVFEFSVFSAVNQCR